MSVHPNRRQQIEIPTGALYSHSAAEKTMIFSNPVGALNFYSSFPLKDFLSALYFPPL